MHGRCRRICRRCLACGLKAVGHCAAGSMQTLRRALGDAAARYTAAFAAGAASGAAGAGAVYKLRQPDAQPHRDIDVSDVLARYEKKIKKLQRQGMERIHWKAVDKEMLGLAPRLWMEVLDEKHRYATLLYDYWRRWQLSDTREYFFNWLDSGAGSLIDLPHAPRRLLEEWRVIYLVREMQSEFAVEIDPSTGRFHWKADGTPVTLPLSFTGPDERLPADATNRERKIHALVRSALERPLHRDRLLAEAREQVARAQREGAGPTRELIGRLAKPLIEEGLLVQLRDPFFEERLDASPTPGGHSHLLLELSAELIRRDFCWADVLRAIDHDEGRMMKTPFPRGEERLKGKGIFVLDTFGCLYCSTKIRGVLHHSSFVRGHCVKVAGGMTIRDGWLVELSPHSGHYQPGQDHVDAMTADWKAKGVDFEKVVIMPYVKG